MGDIMTRCVFHNCQDAAVGHQNAEHRNPDLRARAGLRCGSHQLNCVVCGSPAFMICCTIDCDAPLCDTCGREECLCDRHATRGPARAVGDLRQELDAIKLRESWLSS